MTDKSLGLGKLLSKSKSTIRRARKGSSVDGSKSIESDDATSSFSFSHPSNPHSQSRFELEHDGRRGHDSNEDASVIIHASAAFEDKDSEKSTTTSLVSSTYDSEDQGVVSLTRPIASNHPSQIGYLTTNSPLIQHQYYHDAATTDTQDEHEAYPAGLAPPTSRSSRRSPSPVGRIKNVFRSKKSLSKLSAGSSENSSPERRPKTSDSQRSLDLKEDINNPHPPVPDLPFRAQTQKEAGPGLDNGVEATQEHKRGPAERVNRLSRERAQPIEIRTPPGTPPATSDKGTPPVIVNTPPTPTNTTSPRFSLIRRDNPTEGGKIAQRRGRADSASLVPSKLSTISSAPLTPIESVAATPTNQAPGFFTSVISAAQSAAQNLTNTIANSNAGPSSQKHRSLPSAQVLQKSLVEEDKVEVEPSAEANPGSFMESQEPAFKTIGTGDLSLSQLGIETMSRATTPTTSRFPDHAEQSRTRPDSAPIEASPLQAAAELPWDEAHRPHSLYDPQAGFGEQTPPTGSVYDDGAGVHRSGSIRSAIGGPRTRNSRKRGSTGGTGGTGNTIGAALSAVNTSLAQPGVQIGAPKLTGFAVASKRRNRDFHDLFKSVPDDDYLIEDYSCALQREILAHGRLYVSEGHLCFSSNILGWVTTLVMSFDEIVSVEKRSTALLFKNGLMISTLHAKHIFASFTSRDSTYDLIVKIWKLGHPGLQSSLNGVRLDETGGDKTEKIDGDSIVDGEHSRSASVSDEEEASEDGDDVYDEDEEEDEDLEPAESAEAPLLQSSAIEKSVTRKPSAVVGNNTPSEKPKDAPAAPAGVQDFPGPATHAATDCGDADAHYKRVTGDDVVPAPLGKVYDMLFGPNSAAWMANFLTKDQKCTDLQMEDKKGLAEDHNTRIYNYIKPLSGAIGPKQTKCLISEHLEVLDLENVVRVLVTTQNPDVPSGNVFNVKTKYCLTWAENNATRVQINCLVEWTGKSWLKGPIENGANEGQSQFCKDLFAALKAAVSKRSAAAAGGKGRKRGKKGKTNQAANVTSDSDEPSKASAKHSWGLLEPLHDIIGPVLDIGKPLMTGNLLYGLLVGLLVTAWFGFGRNNRPVARPYGPGLGLYGYPDRLAAYEEMWRREESELWEWLEERVGVERLSNGGPVPHPRLKVVEPRTMEERVREDRMDEREVMEAIRITEEKLRVLKSVVDGNGK